MKHYVIYGNHRHGPFPTPEAAEAFKRNLDKMTGHTDHFVIDELADHERELLAAAEIKAVCLQARLDASVNFDNFERERELLNSELEAVNHLIGVYSRVRPYSKTRPL